MHAERCPICNGLRHVREATANFIVDETLEVVHITKKPCPTCSGKGVIYVADAGDRVAVGHFPSGTEFRSSSGGYRPSLTRMTIHR